MIHHNGYVHFFSQKAFQPIISSQFWGLSIFSLRYICTDFFHEGWRIKSQSKNCGQSPVFFFCFVVVFLFFCCHFAKYLLVHLLPLLPIRILWKLHGVITVTIVTGIVGPLLQGLLGDGLGPPVLLVVGLAALGVRLVKHVCLPLSAHVAATIAPGPARTTAPLWLERGSPPSSATPWTTKRGPSLGVASTTSCRRCPTGPGWRRTPPVRTSATAPHAVNIIIAVVRVFVAPTVVMIVVAIVVVVVVFVSIVIWRICITPSATTAPSSSWRGHARRWVVVVVIIPAEGRVVLQWNPNTVLSMATDQSHVSVPHPAFLVVCLAAWRSFLFLSGGFARTISISSPPSSLPFISSIA